MNEIYWLTRLDGICTFLGFLIFLSIITIFAGFIVYVITCNSKYEDDILAAKWSTKAMKIATPILIFSTIIQVFTPNSKEAMMIFGIGETIDYIKSNDTANQIPDKCIKALDKFVDKYMEEGNNE